MEDVELTVAGTRVNGRLFRPTHKPKAGVLLVHGFNSCFLEFGALGLDLAEAGFLALAIDLRGHGQSGGQRGLINLERASADIDEGLAELRKIIGRKKKIAVIGHSLGGALSLGYTARGGKVAAIVAAQPVNSLFEELGPLEKLGYHALGKRGQRRLRKGKTAGYLNRPTKYEQLFRDPDAARQAAARPFLDTQVNIANYPFAVTMQAADWAARIRVPTLAIRSDHDLTVAPAHTQQVIDALGGPKEVFSHSGGHSCFLDQDGDKISAAIITFLRHHLEN